MQAAGDTHGNLRQSTIIGCGGLLYFLSTSPRGTSAAQRGLPAAVPDPATADISIVRHPEIGYTFSKRTQHHGRDERTRSRENRHTGSLARAAVSEHTGQGVG